MKNSARIEEVENMYSILKSHLRKLASGLEQALESFFGKKHFVVGYDFEDMELWIDADDYDYWQDGEPLAELINDVLAQNNIKKFRVVAILISIPEDYDYRKLREIIQNWLDSEADVEV